eukprot:g24572.t1
MLVRLGNDCQGPDTYVGAIESQKERLWVWDEKKQKIVQKEINFVPGLYKIFDEILVNACDNFQRDPDHMTYIKVNINAEEGWISIANNGATLPVEIHKDRTTTTKKWLLCVTCKEHKMYVPEMVFGHLLTSDNYDDDDNKVTGGRNGYGAKLTNIFSTKFMIECADGERGHRYVQTWENNMGEKGKAKITKYSGKDFTKDAGGSTNKKCKVFLDETPVPVKEFKDYVDLYFEKEESRADIPSVHGGKDQQKVYDKCGDRWEFVITFSEGQFQQVSFVNSINTIKGGTHVSHITEQFVDAILDKVNKRNKGGMEVKPNHIRSHLWVFVNCLVVNPTFDSQTKETMTLKQSKFGSKCEVQDKSIRSPLGRAGLMSQLFVQSPSLPRLVSMGIVDTVLQWAKARETIDMKKKMKGAGRANRLIGIPKLEDANLAGTKHSEDCRFLAECTLILTEGDSAKALAVAGLSIVGRDRFGVFPLRGKPLNVRDATFQATVGNAEIQNIIQILGLEQQKNYDSVTKGQHEVQFFSVADYEAWKERNNGGKGWRTKYYKGLGTMVFRWTNPKDDELIDLAFNKKRADDRKEWINCYKEGDAVDHSKTVVSYTDFVNKDCNIVKELVAFSRYDVMRSIPCFVDGMKPGQRKILYAAFKRNLRSDIKVAQFAGYVAEHSAYHHGEASLQGTIVGMAQNFVGSNNINLFVPSGHFFLSERGTSSESVRVIGCHSDFILAPESPEKVLDALCAAETKIVTMTITEKGKLGRIRMPIRYFVDFTTGKLDSSAPAVSSDLEALKSGSASLKTALGQEIEVKTELKEKYGVEDGWPVVSEEFLLWVVEDKFPSGRPSWDKSPSGKCLFVEDVLPYELLKLRLLNAVHQALAYPASLLGHEVVHEAMADSRVFKFLKAYMAAAGQTVRPVKGLKKEQQHSRVLVRQGTTGKDVDRNSPHKLHQDEWSKTVLERFSNPAVRDTIFRLNEDATNRIAVALAPCLQEDAVPPGRDTVAEVLAESLKLLKGEGVEALLRTADRENPPIKLKKPKFQKISDLEPEAKGVNVYGQVLTKAESLYEEPLVLNEPEWAIYFGLMKDAHEISIGDSSGTVTLRIRGDKYKACSEGKVVRVQNARVVMSKGHMQLLVDKWKWYIPVIPVALVNGADGIGTGWSTSVPNYNPRDIIQMLRKLIKKQKTSVSLSPWYRGFKGSIEPNPDPEKGGFEVAGIVEKISNNQLDITELPIKKWTQDTDRVATGCFLFCK